MSSWSAWSSAATCQCPKSRRKGRKQRFRYVAESPKFNGQPCPKMKGKIHISQNWACGRADQQIACPGQIKKGKYSMWTAWTECNAVCGKDRKANVGSRVRQRLCLRGKCKPSSLENIEKCTAKNCQGKAFKLTCNEPRCF